MRFCDGSELYLLDFELEVIEGTFAIIQRVPIYSLSQEIDILFNGASQTVTVEKFFNIRNTDGTITIDGHGCEILTVNQQAEAEYNLYLENFNITPIPNTRQLSVAYEKVVTRDGIEILREDLIEAKTAFACDVARFPQSSMTPAGFIDKLELATRNPSGTILVDLNPNTVNAGILTTFGYTLSDLRYGSPNFLEALKVVIRAAIFDWGGNSVDYMMDVIFQGNQIKIEFGRVHLPESPYVSIDTHNNPVFIVYPNGKDPANGYHYVKLETTGGIVLTTEYGLCPLNVSYYSNPISSQLGNYYTTVIQANPIVSLNETASNPIRVCSFDQEVVVEMCGPPIVIYNGCDEIVCNPDPKIPLPNHPFDKEECCPKGGEETDDPIVIFDDGKRQEIYLQKENQVFKEAESKMWQKSAENISYPNNLHRVLFDNGKELTLVDEEVRELDGCGRIIKSTPIPTKDQIFSVTLTLNQSSIRAGTATLSNVLQLRTEKVGMTLETADPTTLDPPKEGERRVPFFTFFIQDHLGNSRILYHNKFTECTEDGTRYVLEHVLDYYPYGKTLREYVLQRERFQTTHHERDAATGLDYRGARFYDSEVGRFLSLDPLAGVFAEWSPYNYVLGNPNIFIDPSGRNPESTGEENRDIVYDENGHATAVRIGSYVLPEFGGASVRGAFEWSHGGTNGNPRKTGVGVQYTPQLLGTFDSKAVSNVVNNKHFSTFIGTSDALAANMSTNLSYYVLGRGYSGFVGEPMSMRSIRSLKFMGLRGMNVVRLSNTLSFIGNSAAFFGYGTLTYNYINDTVKNKGYLGHGKTAKLGVDTAVVTWGWRGGIHGAAFGFGYGILGPWVTSWDSYQEFKHWTNNTTPNGPRLILENY